MHGIDDKIGVCSRNLMKSSLPDQLIQAVQSRTVVEVIDGYAKYAYGLPHRAIKFPL